MAERPKLREAESLRRNPYNDAFLASGPVSGEGWVKRNEERGTNELTVL